MSAHTRDAETAYWPIRPRCSTYFALSRKQRRLRGPFAAGTPCKNPAVAILIDPAGERVPGSEFCWDHGAAVLGEYAVKLGEQYGALQIVTDKEKP